MLVDEHKPQMGRCASTQVIADQVAAVARLPNGAVLVKIRFDGIVHHAVVIRVHGGDLGGLACEAVLNDDECLSKSGRELVPDPVDCMSCLVGIARWDR